MNCQASPSRYFSSRSLAPSQVGRKIYHQNSYFCHKKATTVNFRHRQRNLGEKLPSGVSSKGTLPGVQDAHYSLEIASSNRGYATADRGWEFPGGGAQLTKRCPGKEGLGRLGNPWLTVHQRPM
ncbi:UNVERIFIED_CONTAM: hypothetical protein FKN15_074824 [Acipenser sinensis]